MVVKLGRNLAVVEGMVGSRNGKPSSELAGSLKGQAGV